MCARKILNSVVVFYVSMLLMSCQELDIGNLKQKPVSMLKVVKDSVQIVVPKSNGVKRIDGLSLAAIVDGSLPEGTLGSDFHEVMKTALEKDPVIISARRNADAKFSAIQSAEARKDFQVSSTVYGGIEDITDNTKGVALALSASRLVFDGGVLDAQIEAAKFQAESLRLKFVVTVNERALKLGELWVELEKYEKLQQKIDERLAVLDPLISQLERVADAGIGDVSKVTAAQRTVSTIRVAETNISEGLAQAKLNFANAFGALPGSASYNHAFIKKIVPYKISKDLIQSSPLLQSQYAIYQAAVARAAGVRAKDEFSVGFEARAMRPFAGSGYDSDESLGLVARKTLFNGGMLESEVKEAEAMVEASVEQIRATYREGERTIQTSQQNILSMDKAILLARKNAQLTADEIVYLKQQLVIGGSTLDSVLSAEARLYDVESKEINFLAEKQKSQLAIATALGLLSEAVGFSN